MITVEKGQVWRHNGDGSMWLVENVERTEHYDDVFLGEVLYGREYDPGRTTMTVPRVKFLMSHQLWGFADNAPTTTALEEPQMSAQFDKLKVVGAVRSKKSGAVLMELIHEDGGSFLTEATFVDGRWWTKKDAAVFRVSAEDVRSFYDAIPNDKPLPVAASPPTDEYRPGMTVQLNSGGPAMTMVSLGEPNVICCWFTVEGEMRSGSFPTCCIHPVHIEEGTP